VEPIQTPAPAQKEPFRAAEVLQTAEKDIAANKDLAAVSYVWILSVVVFATRRESLFVRFHAKQGMILFVFSIVAAFLPFTRPLELCVLGLAALGFVHAAQGKWTDLPVIGPVSRGDWAQVGPSVRAFVADMKKAYAYVKDQLGMKASASVSPKTTSNPAPVASQSAPTPVPSQP
jgi:uncharacterized membrane protein